MSSPPPWYPKMLKVSLHTASHVLPNSSSLFLCMPGIGTRPGVEYERSQLLGFAEDNGFNLVQYLPGAVRYASPPFEVLPSGLHGSTGYLSIGALKTSLHS